MEEMPSLIGLGGGYLDAGPNHSGGLIQFEYRGQYAWNYFRPGAILMLPNFCSLYLGAGMGYELFLTEKIILIPSFYVGVYYKGKGRNLGHPIEFRSSIELNYVWDNDVRFGVQLYHLSNAHLAHKNPGLNALTIFIAFPIQ